MSHLTPLTSFHFTPFPFLRSGNAEGSIQRPLHAGELSRAELSRAELSRAEQTGELILYVYTTVL